MKHSLLSPIRLTVDDGAEASGDLAQVLIGVNQEHPQIGSNFLITLKEVCKLVARNVGWTRRLGFDVQERRRKPGQDVTVAADRQLVQMNRPLCTARQFTFANFGDVPLKRGADVVNLTR
jgi:hypothetical protein